MFLGLPWGYWLGFALVLWLLFDLVRGVAHLWHPYERQSQPGMYWLTMIVWALVAASCFVYPHWPIAY
ncbi:hypothetical protein [Pseudoalteromonas luteoviolacea]|uniref:Uncharacterized protein n=1 Tax=Pseudoalteromonas luteoviolacea DSM 6061 TaxID=1365250 RepID=A0A166YW12_9GAMM|nr:hypothetical protein [Pseudoalteromonas luteoviolacea]KZN43578.1 hypothetical protein N475_08390 [Pseudoalteromonas luteoviolacea DSM 6061]KZN53649.1 hypothetical protein N474_20160 [Pseudoalteromonas luteoviolacea CPMOR-2]MBE0386541.1 hypothetical protein [Pseudoalteromonas luteoviolacea DSM 6061]TQF71408.1 hypothetical protein FLM44_10040 [Pseudoalteromonas luteoviolacea]